jgi:catechol 2,3-dioxygenase-like lactoylglutathione lyase family enzyme
VKHQETEAVSKADVGVASPLFIVRDVPATLAFYRDELGFDVTFEGPEPNDIFFGIVQRGRAMLMFKAIDVEPVPNHTRDIGHGIASWDAYVYVPDPDALYEEYTAREVDFKMSLCDNSDNLRGFEVRDINGYVIYFGRPN